MDKFYQVEAMQRFGKIRESIYRLDVLLESMARTYRALGTGMETDDLTLPALKIVAGLSDKVEAMTGQPIIKVAAVESLDARQNLNFTGAEARNNIISNFDLLFKLRQKAYVNLINLLRTWIIEQIPQFVRSENLTGDQDVENKNVYQDKILRDLQVLLPHETIIKFDDMPTTLVASFKEVEDALRMLTMSDFNEYAVDITNSAFSALVDGKTFNIPKLKLKQITGGKTEWSVPHAVGDVVIRIDEDDDTLTVGFVDSDQSPTIKCGSVNTVEMTEAHAEFLAIKGRIGKLLESCTLINHDDWLVRLKEMAEQSAMTPDELLMYIYGENLPGEGDQFEKSAKYVGQLLSIESTFSIMHTIAKLVQVLSFASPIIMNYCVNLNK